MMSQKRRRAADEPFLLVRTLASNHRHGEAIEPHAHDWHQLIYASAGVLNVWTERGSWIAPPSWAIRVPAGIAHGIRFSGETMLRTLYLRPDWAGGAGPDCGVITVSPLLRELILRALALGMLDSREAGEAAVALLIRDELHDGDAPPLDLPQPLDPRMRRAAELARTQRTLPGIAAELGMSLSVLERRFRAETGLSLGRWRRQALLLAAMERLAAGERVKSVAAAAGYSTPSAFVAAFRASFGRTPGSYFG